MKKLTAILLVLLLTAALFAGCQNEKTPDTTAAPAPSTNAPSTNAPSTDAPGTTAAPATDAPATDAPATEPPAPAELDGVQLLKDAAEKMKELESLHFVLDLNEDITSEGFTIGVVVKSEGDHTAQPDATYQKGSMEMFGMTLPIEEYSFREGDTVITYSYDAERESFVRSETELEEEETVDEELDYSAMEITAVKDGGEYLVTVNTPYQEAGKLMKLGAGILADSEATEMLPDFSDAEEGAELMGDLLLPFVFRIDEASGRITGFVLDLEALFDAMMEAAGEDAAETIDGKMSGKLEVRYSGFNSVEPIQAPAEFIEEESIDWDDGFDWDEDEDESETEEP